MPTDSELLAEARQAWRSKKSADAKLAHLAGYRSKTPAMKDESRSAMLRQVQAKEVLERVLGGAN